MNTDPQRSKLKKYLGQKLEYNGIISVNDKSVLFYDVRIKNKSVTDHVWSHKLKNIDSIENKSKVSFDAIAYSYIDQTGKRKYGLSHIHNIRRFEISKVDKKIIKNEQHKQLRKKGHKRI